MPVEVGMGYYRGVWYGVPMGDVGQHIYSPEFVAGARR